MSATEVEIKSQHLRTVKAEIDRMESEKYKIEDWVKSKEKEVDALNAQAVKIREGLAVEVKEAKKVSETNKAELLSIEGQRNNLREKEKSLEGKAVNLSNLEGRLVEYEKTLREQEQSLLSKRQALEKRENYIKAVFEGIEALK